VRPKSLLAGKEEFHPEIAVREVAVFLTLSSIATQIHGERISEGSPAVRDFHTDMPADEKPVVVTCIC
jgi:hypothetical protein